MRQNTPNRILNFKNFPGVRPPDPRNPDRVPLLWLTQLSDSSRAPAWLALTSDTLLSFGETTAVNSRNSTNLNTGLTGVKDG